MYYIIDFKLKIKFKLSKKRASITTRTATLKSLRLGTPCWFLNAEVKLDVWDINGVYMEILKNDFY